jgi:hypothetical protein
VFYVYESLATPTADWRAMLDGIRGTDHDAIVLSETSDLRHVDDGHFDGLYTYDVFGVDGSYFGAIAAELARRGAIFAPSVGPGYDETRATRGNHVKLRDNGATYDSMWQRAIASGADWITITSFNEWHEGTQIEPAAPGLGYNGYEGAFGATGPAAELAYIDRTRLMVEAFSLHARRQDLLAGQSAAVNPS